MPHPPSQPARAGSTLAALATATAAMLFAAGATAAGAAKPEVHTIVIEAMVYQPATLAVRRGDTVVWSNRDPFPHTVTAPGAFDSQPIAAGGSWKHVAQRSGNYSYICTLHPTMKGTLSVQ
jgi:plastocyanin